MKKSTMFLNDLSVVDHAYIDQEGRVIGGSFHPSFLVEGIVDEVENVVVDFSTVKKSIKAIIDDDEIGFDHKLWVIDGYSDADIDVTTESATGVESSAVVTIDTPTCHLTLPRNAVKTVSALAYTKQYIGAALAKYVFDEITKTHEGITKITCYNSVTPHLVDENQSVSYFRYVHGLKDSTSWGCQNNSHGHLSFIQVGTNSIGAVANWKKAIHIQGFIAEALDNTIFINRENITNETVNSITIDYTTPDRGQFKATYYKNANKIIILDSETTIEFLVDYIKDTWSHALSGYDHLMVSEGLSKGAYISLN